MADQYETVQAESLRDYLDVVRHRDEVVPAIRRDGFAPAALVEGDAVRLSGEPLNDGVPSS
jgi:hypothetical protein